MSSVMHVSVKSASLHGKFVLKLYDRRHAIQLRKDEGRSGWTEKTESRYLKSVHEGHAIDVFNDCDARFQEDKTWSGDDSWNDAQWEAYLQYICIKSYEIESRAYDKLLDMQGKYVPRLFARGWLQPNLEAGLAKEFVGCPGILLEHIQGFALTDLRKHAPKTDWQSNLRSCNPDHPDDR